MADYRWREAFARADVVSEGATRAETAGLVYYGTTSIVLPYVSCGGSIPDAESQAIVHALDTDPHARLRAVRIACLEARLRSCGPLRRVRTDTSVRLASRGVCLDVEVEAPVIDLTIEPKLASG